MKRIGSMLAVQAYLILSLIRQGSEFLDVYMSSIMLLLVIGAVLLITPIFCGEYRCPVAKQKFVLFSMMGMSLGVALQAISVMNAGYMNLVLVLSTVFGVLFVLFSRMVMNHIPMKLRVVFFTGVTFMLYAILVVTGVLNGVGNTTTSIAIGGISLNLVLFAIPLYCLLISSIYAVDTSFKKQYLCIAVITMINVGGLVLLNELGTAMVILVLCIIGIVLNLKWTYSVITLALGSVGALFGWLILYIGHQSYLNGSKHTITTLLYSIYVKLESRFGIFLHLFENADNYQLIQARKAIAVGGLFGSKIEETIPVAASDFAFPYSILKFGLVFAVIFILILVFMVKHVEVIGKIGDPFERSVATLFLYGLGVQSILTILGTTAFFPLSGMPIVFISKSGVYFLITMMELFYITSLNTEPKQLVNEEEIVEEEEPPCETKIIKRRI